MPRCLAAALFAAFVCAVAAQPASAASFNCDRAYTALEKTVCADRRLSALDEQMAQNYLGLLRRVSGAAESAIKAEQKNWLKQRNACEDDKRCISKEYRARIKRIANAAASQGLIVDQQRPARATATTAGPPRTSLFAPRTAETEPASADTFRTTAERAAAPTPAGRTDTQDAKENDAPKSPGLIKRVLSKVAPNLTNRDSVAAATGSDLETPPALRDDQTTRVTRRDDKVRRNQSVLPTDQVFEEPARREANVARDKSLPPDQTPARRKTVTTTRDLDTAATPPPQEAAPVTLAAPQETAHQEKKRKLAKDDDPNAPAVLLYTTPDVSRVIRLPDGESPFDKLDAQHAFEEPPPAPVRVLKATPESLPQPSKRAFDASRFDAFDDSPNG